MKKILIFALFILQCQKVYSQTFELIKEKVYGGENSELYPAIVNIGSQLFIAAYSASPPNADIAEWGCDSTVGDIWFMEIDTGLNKLWDKCIGGIRAEVNIRFLNIYNKSFFYMTCASNSDSSCEKSQNPRCDPDSLPDYWIIKMDTTGNVLWDKTYGGTRWENSPQLIELGTGDLILGGSSTSDTSGDKTALPYTTSQEGDYWILKLDSNGNKIWDRVYGGIGIELAATSGLSYLPYYQFGMVPEGASDFVFAGCTDGPPGFDVTDSSRGDFDIWMARIDSAGTKLWDKRFGGSGEEQMEHLIKTADGGYLICGYTTSPADGEVSDTSRGAEDIWLLKLDSMGNKMWDRRYGGNKRDLGHQVEEAPGGGYWISGETDSDSSSEVSEKGYGKSDYWMIKTDSAGNMTWNKRFGGPKHDRAPVFVILPDSSIIVCGHAEAGISSMKTDSGRGYYDLWMIHFKLTDSLISNAVEENQALHITVYPNPAQHEFQVSNNDVNEVLFSLYTVSGIPIVEQNIRSGSKQVFSTKGFSQGYYLWKAECKGKNQSHGELVIVK